MENYLPFIEWTAVILNILYVILAAYEKRICWIFGGIASLLSIVYFLEINLVSESFLYLFYSVIAIYGFINWGKDQVGQKIVKWKIEQHAYLFGIALILAAVLYFFSSLFSNAEFREIDALTTSFSILATYLVIKKVLSNWIYWIVIDIVTTVLYFMKDSNIYAAQMIIFTLLAVLGYIKWLHQYRLEANVLSND